jgi:hypothetical protein
VVVLRGELVGCLVWQSWRVWPDSTSCDDRDMRRGRCREQGRLHLHLVPAVIATSSRRDQASESRPARRTARRSRDRIRCWRTSHGFLIPNVPREHQSVDGRRGVSS